MSRVPARVAAAILVLLAIGLYLPTVAFDYALDDGVVILENRFVTSGLGGVPDLLTKDTFAGAFGEGDTPPGGRYRPLSLVTFALEWELFGRSPATGHLVNVLLYALTGLLVFRFSAELVFGGRWPPAFVAAWLFLVHPVHSEVVANIKGRDELLVFTCLLVATGALLRAGGDARRVGPWIASVVVYALALLSKETGLVLLAIAPAALWCLRAAPPRRIAVLLAPHVLLTAIYLLVRVAVTGVETEVAADILDAPYLYATGGERVATSLHVLGRYVGLLLWPASLSYDYSYAQIPYRDFSDASVWVSAALYAAVLVGAVVGVRRRSAVGFGLVVFLASLLPVSNLIVDVGASPLGERFLFVPSFGFVVVVAAAWARLARAGHARFTAMVALVLLLGALGVARTWARIPAWRSNETLFLTDVSTVPNSARAQNGAGIAWYGRARRAPDDRQREDHLARAFAHLHRAIEIHPRYVDGWFNLGAAYGLDGQLEPAEECLRQITRIRPGYPGIPAMAREISGGYLARARSGSSAEARLGDLRKAAQFAPLNAGVIGELADTLHAQGETDEALLTARRARDLAPGDAAGLRRVGDLALAAGDTVLARAAWRDALRITPGDSTLARRVRSVTPGR